MKHPLVPLAENEVRVEILDIEGAGAGYADHAHCLSAEEVQKIESLADPAARRVALISRVFLRLRLAAYLGCSPESIRFRLGEKGKPSLDVQSPDGAFLHFNLSHSANMIALALSLHRELGIDIQQVKPSEEMDPKRMAQIAFTSEELEEFEGLPEHLQSRAFFQAWVRKEAFAKGLGIGLELMTHPSAKICVDPRLEPSLVSPTFERRQWVMKDLPPMQDGNFLGSLAFSRGRRGDQLPDISLAELG